VHGVGLAAVVHGADIQQNDKLTHREDQHGLEFDLLDHLSATLRHWAFVASDAVNPLKQRSAANG
jgi:hypothetical protein